MIDLNADIGEGFGTYTVGMDTEIMKHVTSVNIATGFHAGDPVVMYNTIKEALACGVKIGAHPGYPDLQGFGRRELAMSPQEIYCFTLYQIGAIKTMVEAQGGRLNHVKPHGALYNRAAKDRDVAQAIAKAIADIDNTIAFYGLANSLMKEAANQYRLNFVSEVFSDRAYNLDRSLVNRQTTGAVITDKKTCLERVKEMVQNKRAQTIDTQWIDLEVGTICLHGDNPSAIQFAQSIAGMINSHRHD